MRHIEIVSPKIIVAIGGSSAKAVLNIEGGILRHRGLWKDLELVMEKNSNNTYIASCIFDEGTKPKETRLGRFEVNKIQTSRFIKKIWNIKLFFIFFNVFYSINAIGNDITLPKPLSKNDEKLYRKVFQLQTEGKFKKQKTFKNIENNILIGRVKAQKYLHPTGYISKFVELRDWLEKMNHPSASRIYWLSKRKSPKIQNLQNLQVVTLVDLEMQM